VNEDNGTDADGFSDVSPGHPSSAAGSDRGVLNQRMLLRLHLWQTILSVAGVVTAVIALWAALKESAAVREQTAATVWPIVQLSLENYDDGKQARFALRLTNAGIGPARINAIRVTVDGKAYADWADVLAAMGSELLPSVGRNWALGRVLIPGEGVYWLDVQDPELVRRISPLSESERTRVELCYCSIFEQCWLSDSRASQRAPVAVAECPDFGEQAFQY